MLAVAASYYLLGWLACLRYDPLAGLYESGVGQWPQVPPLPGCEPSPCAPAVAWS